MMEYGSKRRWEVSHLLFAVDTVWVADSRKKLQVIVSELEVCVRRELKVNVAKNI